MVTGAGKSRNRLQTTTTTTKPDHSRPTCLVLHDVSSMETDAGKPEVNEVHVTSGSCADDIDVLEIIETCYGVQPVLLSTRVEDRRKKSAGKYVFWTIMCRYLDAEVGAKPIVERMTYVSRVSSQ